MSGFAPLQKKQHRTPSSPIVSPLDQQKVIEYTGRASYSINSFSIRRPGAYGEEGRQHESVPAGQRTPPESAPVQLQQDTQSTNEVETGGQQENHTGLPDALKAGVEQLSGSSLSDVRVHYNSSRPAELGALAYTQGSQIHVGPGQERHLAHEAWHVIQQKRGRVQPTARVKGLAMNDAAELEKEADVMGTRASQRVVLPEGGPGSLSTTTGNDHLPVVQRVTDLQPVLDACGMKFMGVDRAHVITLKSKSKATKWHATFYSYIPEDKPVFNDFHITSVRGRDALHHFYTDNGEISMFSTGDQADYGSSSWGQANRHASYIYKEYLGMPIEKQALDQQIAQLGGGAAEQYAPEEEQEEGAAFDQDWQQWLEMSWEDFLAQMSEDLRPHWQLWYDGLGAEEKAQWQQMAYPAYYGYGEQVDQPENVVAEGNEQPPVELPPVEEQGPQEGAQGGESSEEETAEGKRTKKKQKV